MAPLAPVTDEIFTDLLMNLCNCIKEGAAIIDISSKKIVFCNHSLVNMFGFDSADEIDFQQLAQRRKLQVSEQGLQYRLQLIREKGFFSEEVEYIKKNEEEFWGELTMRSFTADGTDYFLIVLDQIDKVKQKELKIEQDKQRFEALLEHASMGIIETNSEAAIININPFALKIFGYAKEELLGKKIEQLIPSRFHSKHVKNREDYISHTRNRPMGVGMDLYAIKKDGSEFPVEVSLSSYRQDGNKFVIAFISDITIRKEAELAVKKLNDQLEELVDLRTTELKNVVNQLQLSRDELSKALEKEKELSELKSRFVSMASHEFRTPLSTVLSSAYLLGKYTSSEEQPKRERHLQRIISSVNMLTDILNDFLSVGKIEEGKVQVRPAEFDIREFITGIAEEVKNNHKKDQHILYEHLHDTAVLLDPSLLKHIVMNLLSNASKFSPEASTIVIRTVNTDTHVELSVKDHGMGISREDQAHLMERFFRGTNATNIQGTGLGLHIISKYAELMNGTVECRSELNKGTEFTIIFSKNNNHEKDLADRG